MSDSLWAHGLQHARLPCPSLSSGVCSDSCPLSQWCHPTISSVTSPISSLALSLSQHQGLFQWVDSSYQVTPIGASASVLPMNIQGWFPLRLICLISHCPRDSQRVFSSTTIQKHHFFSVQSSLWSNSHIHTWLLEKPYLWLYRPLSAKWSLCFLIFCLDLS